MAAKGKDAAAVLWPLTYGGENDSTRRASLGTRQASLVSISDASSSSEGGSLCRVGSEEEMLASDDAFDAEVIEEYSINTPPTPPSIAAVQPKSTAKETGARQKNGWRSIRYDIDNEGYCLHHPDIQLKRLNENRWTVVRKKCPECIKADCPTMKGGESLKPSDRNGNLFQNFGIINFLQPKRQPATMQMSRPSCCNEEDDATKQNGSDSTSCSTDNDESNKPNYDDDKPESMKRSPSILQTIVDDFTSQKGDQKILRAIGRTTAVNAAVLLTAATGGAAGAIGYVTGGAITSKRLVDGVIAKDEKEVTKSLAVYGCATGASIAGQAVTGALMIGLAGASLPLAGAVAFGVGCCTGITAGAVSEWTVDKCYAVTGGDRGKNGNDCTNTNAQ